MNRRRITASIIVVAAFLPLYPLIPVQASEYPAKPISLIIPYTAGGSTDATGRALANAAKKYLGQPVICENKGGGGATVGPALLLTKPADGYTIGFITSGAVIASHMGKINFNPLESFSYIMHWGRYSYGICVRADSQFKTIQELIQYSKQNPKKLTYGSSGVGGPPHLATEELSMVAGFQWVYVPYKGTSEVNPALLGGHIDVLSDASGYIPLVDGGKFRLLATWGYQRSVRYPQVPTIKEIGYDVVIPGPIGIVGPKGMPKPIMDRLQDAFHKAMGDPEFLAAMKTFDMEPVYMNSADYEKSIRQDSERVGKIVRKLGLEKK